MDDTTIESEVVETDHGTYRVRVVPDEVPGDSPREDSNLGTMVLSQQALQPSPRGRPCVRD